jgi:hypothetical protein
MNIEKNCGLLGRVVGLLTITAALAGCGGSGGSGSASEASAAAPATSASAAASPTVSGSPAVTVAANSAYSFRPTSGSPSGMALTFSIQNKPSWATFGLSNGQLSGTPSASETGKYANIVIAASDGTTSTALPGFAIQVTSAAPPVVASSSGGSSSGGSSSSSSSGAKVASTTGSASLTWAAPTQNTDGSALSNLAGYDIYYGTSASAMTQKITLTNASMLTDVVSNLASGTWFFEVIAVNSTGEESNPSGVVSMTI